MNGIKFVAKINGQDLELPIEFKEIADLLAEPLGVEPEQALNMMLLFYAGATTAESYIAFKLWQQAYCKAEGLDGKTHAFTVFRDMLRRQLEELKKELE